MRELYKIGEVSKLYDIEVSALRYYSDIGLFEPAVVDKDTGYRYYHIEQFNTLSRIIGYKKLGIPLKEIKKKVYDANIDDTLEFIDEVENTLVIQLKDTQKKLDYLRKQKHQIKRLKEKNFDYELVESPDLIMFSYNFYLKKQNIENESALDIKAGFSSIDRRFFEYSRFGRFIDYEKFKDTGEISILERGLFSTDKDFYTDDFRYIGARKCVRCFIDSPKDTLDSEYERIYNYIEEQGYEVSGNLLEVGLYEYISNDVVRKLLEIYIPIKI